jgi:hypothetical protein
MIKEDDPRHGTNRGYGAGCRLYCCVDAHTIYSTQKKIERVARGIPERVHGTRNGYTNYGCRCTRCQISMVGTKKKPLV